MFDFLKRDHPLFITTLCCILQDLKRGFILTESYFQTIQERPSLIYHYFLLHFAGYQEGFHSYREFFPDHSRDHPLFINTFCYILQDLKTGFTLTESYFQIIRRSAGNNLRPTKRLPSAAWAPPCSMKPVHVGYF